MEPDSGKKRKILYIITKGNFGGAQRYVFEMAHGLPKDKFEVAVAFGEGNGLEEKLKEAGIRTIRMDSLTKRIRVFSDLKTFFSFLKLYKSEKPDIVHLNSSKSGGIGSAVGFFLNLFRRLFKQQRILIIFTAHGWAFNEDLNFASKRIIKFFQWLTVFFSDYTIAVSAKTAKDILKMPFSKNRVKVIYNGIEKYEILPKKEAREKILPGSDKKVLIGTVAELNKNKGVDYAIRAFKKIPYREKKATLIIVGEGEERKHLERLVFDLNLQNDVFFTGRLEEARKYISAFDLFLLTSRTEAFPYVLLEAGMAKLPVISTNIGGVPEVIENEKTGLLTKPRDTKDISQAIIHLIKDKKLAKFLGKNLNKKIKENFSSKETLDKTMEIYLKDSKIYT